MGSGFMYLWEFRVAPESVQAFVRMYGPEGDWVRLFRRAPGYLRSELHRDRQDPLRFVTIDYWESVEACTAFRKQYAREFEAQDAAGAALTTAEKEIGVFAPVTGL